MKRKLQKKLTKTVFYLGLTLLVFAPFSAKAFGIPFYDLPTLGDMGMSVLFAVLGWLDGLMGLFLAVAIAVIDLVTSSTLFDEVFFSPQAVGALNITWGLVRDFVNMFFILILVFLAIATILRINKYSDKRMLLYVIMAALLVNFSMPITMIVIDASNLAMGFFIDNINTASGSYANALLNNMEFSEALDSTTTDNIETGVAVMVAIIFKFILAFMLFVLGITLVIRLVAFWVLIILSPLAFFAMALPGTMISKIKDGWVSKLVGWALYGPVMLFFFWIAIVMVTALSDSIEGSTAESAIQLEEVTISEEEDTFIVGAFRILIPFSATVYLLFYGYSLSRSMAAGVGGAAASVLNRGTNWMRKGAGVGAAVGTLGGTAWLAGQYKAAREGVSQRSSFLGVPMTKQAREDRHKKRVARYAGKTPQYQTSQINDQLKSWDEKGAPSVDNLKSMVKGDRKASPAEKQAAALRLAKEGDVDSETYRSAMASLGKNPKLEARFKDQARKHNRHAMIDYDVQKAIKEQEKSGNRLSAQQRNELRQTEFNKHLEKMDLSKIGEQDSNFHESPEFEGYMKKKVAKGDWTEDTLKKQNISAEKRAIWRRKNFFAGGSSGTGGGMSEGEAQDSMRDMNS